MIMEIREAMAELDILLENWQTNKQRNAIKMAIRSLLAIRNIMEFINLHKKTDELSLKNFVIEQIRYVLEIK